MLKNKFFDTNSLLLRLAGLTALISIPFHHLSSRVHNLLPMNGLLFSSRYADFVLGIVLLYVADQLARKKRSAYWVSVIGLGLLTIFELARFRNPLQLGLYSIVLTSIIKDRRLYAVKSDSVSLRRAIVRAGGILGVIIVFSILLLSRIDTNDFGHDLSPQSMLSVVGRSLVGAPLPPGIHEHRNARRIVELLRLAGVAALLTVGFSLFQPLKLRRPAPRSHQRLARDICERYSRSTEDYLKLWPSDKHYFFYQDSFIAYKLVNSVALVLDGVTGKPSDSGRARPEFLAYAHGNGWTVAIVHADAAEAEKWQRYNMQSLFIGSEAAVDTAEFTSKTIRDKHFRYVVNKAIREALAYERWQPPLSASQLADLRVVSDAWLKAGRREYTYSMGYFEDEYLRQCQVGVLRQNDAVVAYTNLLPSFQAGTASIDHMRVQPGLAQVAMHYLLLRVISDAHASSVRLFNLGLAPLSKLDEQPTSNVSERVLGLVKTLGSRYYSFSGLEQFKGKFRPDWEGRYLVYEGGPGRLPVIGNALNSAMAYKPKRRV